MAGLLVRWRDLPLFVKGAIVGAIPVIPLILIAVLVNVSDGVDPRATHTRAFVLAGTAGGIGGGVLAAWIFMSGVAHRLQRATRDAIELGAGRALGPSDPSRDEIGQVSRGLRRAAELLADREAALRESEAFLSSIVESIPAMIFIKGADDLRFVQLNRAGEELLGISRDELIGRRDSDLFPPQQAEAFMAADRRTLAGKEMLIVEEEVVNTKHHGPRLLHTKKMPVLGQDGTPRFLLGISHDVTEQREAHEAIKRARAEAEEASRAKNDFLSRMSHELRTPLNAVLGFAQLLRLEQLNADQLEYVTQILRGGQHLLDLINEVLDITRIESGQLSLSPEPISLTDSVKHATDLIRPLADQQQITLHTALQAAYAVADRQRLNQILLNLLSNGVKYNRPGGRVDVTSERLDGRVRITITDTGFGIPPERLKRLFTPFDRLGAEQSGVEGTGLGLALCKRLAEALGGTLTFTTALGRGSSFVLELQAADAPKAHASTPAGGPLSAEAATGDVLYIEDNIANARLMERIISRRPGVRLRSAPDGATGLRLIEEHRPHLVLLDLHLPDMPGEEVLRRLRGTDLTSHIPIAILSADATPAQKRRLLSMGASVYMSKPLNVAQVLELVDSVLPQGRDDER